jgi:hypothetical protein
MLAPERKIKLERKQAKEHPAKGTITKYLNEKAVM